MDATRRAGEKARGRDAPEARAALTHSGRNGDEMQPGCNTTARPCCGILVKTTSRPDPPPALEILCQHSKPWRRHAFDTAAT